MARSSVIPTALSPATATADVQIFSPHERTNRSSGAVLDSWAQCRRSNERGDTLSIDAAQRVKIWKLRPPGYFGATENCEILSSGARPRLTRNVFFG